MEEIRESNSRYFNIMDRVERDINVILPNVDCVVADDYKTIKTRDGQYRLEIKQVLKYYVYDELGNLLYETTKESEALQFIEDCIMEDSLDI